MVVKTYKAPTIKEAVDAAKEELGVEAQILRTKKIKEGGVLGFGAQEFVEVMMAVEDEEPKKPPKKKTAERRRTTVAPAVKANVPQTPLQPAIKPATPVLPPSVLVKYKTDGTSAGVSIAEQTAAAAVAPPIPSAVIQAPNFTGLSGTDLTENAAEQFVPGAPQAQKIVASSPAEQPVAKNARRPKKSRVIKAADAETDVAEEYIEQPFAEKNQNIEGNFSDAKKIQKLEDELAQMKALLAEVMSKKQPEEVFPLHEALRQQEVEQKILTDLAGKSSAGETLVDWRTDAAKTTLRNYLKQSMSFTDGIDLVQKGVRIAALIGPTGVGKTTTLAKIAAKFVLEKGARTALITADTYRISAVEQLKTYSDIIGLPLEIVYSPEELRKAIRRHTDKDLILIDTAGRSQHNDFQIKELKDLLRVNRRIEKHLVISATTKSRDAADIMEKFSVCEPTRLIFTKADETRSLGIIMNMLCGNDIALSYLANGQNVPDDIMPADAEVLTDLLLRE